MISLKPAHGAMCVALLAGLTTFFYQSQSASLLGVDAYFHLKLSALIGENGLIRNLTWLPYTIYADQFVDDRLLFHLILTPFSGGDSLTGAHLYASIVSALVFALFYLILSSHHVRWPGLWTLALAVSSIDFAFRLNLVRAPGLSLLFLLVGCWLILAERDRWLMPLGFLFAWAYGGFPVLLVQTGLAALAFTMGGGRRWRMAGWALLGCAAGIVINPYFPGNVEFLWQSYTEIELGRFPAEIVAGNEDYPYASSTAVRKAILVWVLVFVAITAYCVRPIQLTGPALYLFLFSVALLCLYLVARRFIEYWPPFALLFAAFALDHWWSAAPTRWRVRLKPVLLVAVPAVTILAGFQTASGLQDARTPERQPSHYAGAVDFIQSTVARDEIVFHSSWGDFPVLFYLNDENRYIAGLGLHYLYRSSKHLHGTYVSVCDGEDPTPTTTIVEQFDARYAFSRKVHTRFLASLDADPGASRVFEDEHAVVFRLTADR